MGEATGWGRGENPACGGGRAGRTKSSILENRKHDGTQKALKLLHLPYAEATLVSSRGSSPTARMRLLLELHIPLDLIRSSTILHVHHLEVPPLILGNGVKIHLEPWIDRDVRMVAAYAALVDAVVPQVVRNAQARRRAA